MDSISTILIKRCMFGFLTLFTISVIIFMGVELLPGDAAEAILGQRATPETVEAFRKELKLDLPPHVRYLTWLGNFVKGDLGNSLTNGRPVAHVIGWRFQNTLFLALSAALISVPLSIVLGLLAALYRNSLFDRFICTSTLTTISLPEFFVAYVLIAIFSVQIPLFPSMTSINAQMDLVEKIHSIMLPCITLTLVVMAHMLRLTRASIINVIYSPFIEMAELKGLSRSRIIVKHALPNAVSPIINVVVLNLAYLIVGVVVVEVVFVYPGLGQLLVDAVSKRDLPVIQATSMIFACTYVMLNLSADILSILGNPKLRNPV